MILKIQAPQNRRNKADSAGGPGLAEQQKLKSEGGSRAKEVWSPMSQGASIRPRVGTSESSTCPPQLLPPEAPEDLACFQGKPCLGPKKAGQAELGV